MATVTKPIALDESLHTTEQTPRNVADVLAQELARIAGRQASDVNYDSTDSGLTADNVQDAIDELASEKVDKEAGKGLSTNDYTDAEKAKLAGIEANAEVNVQSDWSQADSSADDYIKNKPTADEQTATDTFSTINGGLLSECKVSLTPIQDLHGYDSPWVGGSRKNKLPLVLADIKALNTTGTWSDNVYTINGGTITIDTDVDGNVIDIKANGTFTERTVLFIARPISNYHPTSGSYIVNKSYQNVYTILNVDGYNNNTWVQSLAKSSNVDDVQFTVDYSGYDRLSIYLEILSGVSTNNIIFKPMIRLSTESDPTFEPYSNICPISGHTQVDVDVSDGQTTQEQVTVNLGGTYYSGVLDVVTGVFNPDKKGINLSDIGWSGSNGAFYSTNPILDIKHGGGRYDYVISSGYKTANKSSLSQLTDGEISVDASGYLQIKDNQYTTSASFVSDRGSIQIVYELATTTPIQLSPTMVKALVGENHLSAPLEGQEITESKYKQMFTFDDVIAYIQSLS